MHRINLTRAALVAAILVVTLGGGRAGAAVSQTRTCPFEVVGGDPDFVSITQLQPGHWRVLASETESAANLVALHVAFNGSGSATPSPAVNQGLHDTTVDLTLTPGATYTIDWQAAFDFGLHPCASAMPGQSAFTITA